MVLSSPGYPWLPLFRYAGAQRTSLGVFVANATWPNTAWTLVVDDDNVVLPARFKKKTNLYTLGHDGNCCSF